MKPDCEICGGSYVVRLPIRPRLTARPEPASMICKPMTSSREYPCPECARETPEHKVMTFGAEVAVQERHLELYRPQVLNSVQGQLGNMLADRMMSSGVVKITEQGGNDDNVTFRATVGVVSKASVATIDQRATEKMAEFLNGVLEKASDSISIWGSAYTGTEGMISKGLAVDFVSQAFRKALEDAQKRSATE